MDWGGGSNLGGIELVGSRIRGENTTISGGDEQKYGTYCLLDKMSSRQEE